MSAPFTHRLFAPVRWLGRRLGPRRSPSQITEDGSAVREGPPETCIPSDTRDDLASARARRLVAADREGSTRRQEAAAPDAPAQHADALQRARVLQQALQPPDPHAAPDAPAAPVPASAPALSSMPQCLPAAVLPGKRLLLDLCLSWRQDELVRVSAAVGQALAAQPALAGDARRGLEALLAYLIRQHPPGLPEPMARLLLSLGEAELEIMLRDDALPVDLGLQPLDPGLGVVHASMDEVCAFHDGRGNLIVLRKALCAAQPVSQIA